jgi:hypothetical protein
MVLRVALLLLDLVLRVALLLLVLALVLALLLLVLVLVLVLLLLALALLLLVLALALVLALLLVLLFVHIKRKSLMDASVTTGISVVLVAQTCVTTLHVMDVLVVKTAVSNTMSSH